MRMFFIPLAMLALTGASEPVEVAAECGLTPKEVATTFMERFYLDKDVRGAFETWVAPDYIQHNPMAATGRDAAIAFLEPYFKQNPDIRYTIKRVIAEGDLVVFHTLWQQNADDRGAAVVDILRVEGCKVMEHWDVIQPVPEQSANSNGML
ncbi:nuclear transport factor 2 family protein [Parerythrobacter aestuarii]|uniref:nuclear transport factor 2 family protein n=1 Tax=Parerythrobacter aestuarii TaxID=3020909 RepID=UPI0024DE7B2D|nr:nuclear transport factor 2 family protein [Parerythrobacter aestuarii]